MVVRAEDAADHTGGRPTEAEERAWQPLRLGPEIVVWPPVVLAPMAGVTNYPYRKICAELGSPLNVSEMVSGRGLLESGRKTWQLAHFGEDERPRSIQLIGCDPVVMREAARRLRAELDVDHIDLNFGCPVPKVVRKGMGAAATVDLSNFRRIVGEVVRAAAPAPVTVKFRLGLDDDSLNYVEVGRIAAGEGAVWVAVHARTVRQMYSGRARWEHITRLAEAVDVPVLGNGDIFAAADAVQMMRETGCDGVVVGRGCLGNPWLFRDLCRVFDGSGEPARPTVEELVDVIRRHYELLERHFADTARVAALQMRKFGTWYARGIKGSTQLRTRFQRISSRDDLEVVLADILAAGYEAGIRDPRLPTRFAD